MEIEIKQENDEIQNIDNEEHEKLKIDTSDIDSDSSTYSEFAEDPPTKRHKCTYNDCNKSFYRPSKLADHIRYHKGERPFKCDEPECGKAYHKKEALKRHKKNFHLENIENVMCSVDGCLQVMRKTSLKKHMLRKHNPLRKYKFQCPECNKGFRKESELINHSNEHSPIFKCSLCGRAFQQGGHYRRHLKTHKMYKCLCEEKFIDFTLFRIHKKTCDLLRPRCAICAKEFSSNFNLNQHLKYVHSFGEGDPPEIFKCTYEGCSKQYNQSKNLKQHISNCHTNENKEDDYKWFCKDCQKCFKKYVYYKKHQKKFHLRFEPKISKPRRPRKDEGIPKIPMITTLTGVELTIEDNKKIIHEDALKC